MRLSPDQVQAIRRTAHQVLGAGANVSVFGSMAQDNRKGGDIDFLFEIDTPPAPVFEIAKRTGVPL